MHLGLVSNCPNIELVHGWSSFRQYWRACVHHLKHHGQIHHRLGLTLYERCLTFEAGYQKFRRQNLYGRCLAVDHQGQAFSCIVKVWLMDCNRKWYTHRKGECQGLGNSQSSDMNIVCGSSDWRLIPFDFGTNLPDYKQLPLYNTWALHPSRSQHREHRPKPLCNLLVDSQWS